MPLISKLSMSQWRREMLRTNFWLMPSLEVLASIALFWATLEVDRAVYHGVLSLPAWVEAGSADTAREILLAVAAAIMTVIGINFSVTIVTLTLASTQFGPRMLRNFIRDRGTQLTLGTFVATAVYCVLVLLAIGPAEHGVFVPHLSVSVVFLLVLVDLAVLIYFLHHIAIQIQLPFVIASIAKDLTRYLKVRRPDIRMSTGDQQNDREEITALIDTIASSGAMICTPKGGYLQAIRYDMLIRKASAANAVVRLPYRPGNFLVEDGELAAVWPPEAADHITRCLKRAQVTGPVRTLAQDPAFGIDQLVEIAIRALSPAVNDTYTALACVDWLGNTLCKLAKVWTPAQAYRDRAGAIRVICEQVSYENLVERAFDKIRQASRGMPAVLIRQLESLKAIMEQTTDPDQARALMDQAAMIQRSNLQSVPEESDRADVESRYSAVASVYARRNDSAENYPQRQHDLRLAGDAEPRLSRGGEG
ncbi:MAG: DUF2254 domain-containing protein [Mycobacterium sp.]|uniref:DUF2254 domain-containing protein n=1 Tax=Mycobacterium sp. TaxID=1785 RepID=UPI003C6ACFBF